MAIILARHGQPAIRLERTTIDRESYLQQYIFAHPDALPLDEVDEDVRLLVLLREFPTSSGPIDALATDGELRLGDWRQIAAGDRPALPATNGWMLSLVPTQLERLIDDPAACAWLRPARCCWPM